MSGPALSNSTCPCRRPWSPGRAPGRCRWSARRRGASRGHGPELAAGSGRWRRFGARQRSRPWPPGRAPRAVAAVTGFEPPGGAGGPHVGAVPAAAVVPSSPTVTCFEAPGDADGPHAGAVPAAAMVPSSPPAPGGDYRVRPRRCRRSARRRDPARGQDPELAAGSGRRSPGSSPGRRRWSGRRRGPGREARHRCRSARSRPWSPGSTPGDAGDPHVGAVPGVLTGSSPWAMATIRTPAAPGREARHRCRSARPRPWSPGSSPAMPAIRTSARSRPRPWSRARRRLRAAVTGFEPRATPTIRTSAAPGVRLAIDAGPHGPGPWSPGRARAMPTVRTPARSRPRPWSRARRRLRVAITGFDPGRWRRFARRPPRA